MKKPILPLAFIPVMLLAILLTTSCGKGGSGSTPTPVDPVVPPKPAATAPKVDTLFELSSQGMHPTFVVGHDSVATGGFVSGDGGATVTERGVCWSETPNPTIAGSRSSSGTGTGAFSSPIGKLKVNTKYYLRAYATNSAGTGYSPQLSFVTAFKIGEYYQGGYVFSIDATTVHGLIATKHLFSEVGWGAGAAGAYSTTDGKANTDKIVALFGTTAKTAAGTCRACRDGGYSDWYLPAINQLSTLYNSSAIPYDAVEHSYDTWSSTELTTNSTWAYLITHQYGNAGSDTKTAKYTVRPIRAF
ncbi:DUF1566 domain-containing protein [Mucilaginibacter sp.]|uniref:Lcl C-terminal domain-containing protein n=1 Tax=Mucilaginibacter sp. TaxID=1882438 RepID=UPI003264909D